MLKKFVIAFVAVAVGLVLPFVAIDNVWAAALASILSCAVLIDVAIHLYRRDRTKPG